MHFCVCMSLACWVVEIETIQNKWESSSQTLRSSPLLSFFPQEEDRFYLVNEGPDFLEIERRGVITQWLLSYSQSSNFLALESPDKVGRRRRREERPDEFLRR